jgi:hypothetical protein
VEQREVPVDATRQQGGVLVVGLHHQTATLEVAEILGERERHARASSPEGGVRDHVRAQLLDEGDPGILDPPDLVSTSTSAWILRESNQLTRDGKLAARRWPAR